MLRALVLAAVAACPTIAAAYPDGAPPGHTGGFGEPDCTACHFAEPVHTSLGLEGLNANYQPGQTYNLQLHLESAEAQVAGFQLTARFVNSGAEAGSLMPTGKQQLTTRDALTYLSHQHPARVTESGSAFIWTDHHLESTGQRQSTYHLPRRCRCG